MKDFFFHYSKLVKVGGKALGRVVQLQKNGFCKTVFISTEKLKGGAEELKHFSLLIIMIN